MMFLCDKRRSSEPVLGMPNGPHLNDECNLEKRSFFDAMIDSDAERNAALKQLQPGLPGW
jgi:hypothetical protein